MDISVDRYLDDGRTLLMTLGLRSRTTEMHSVLSALGPAEREAVQDTLARACADVTAILRPVAAAMVRRG